MVRETLAQRDYRLFTTGSITANVGMWVQRVAIGWLIWDLTGSGAWLGLIAMADLFPMVVISPLAGVYADRFERLRATRVSQWLLMLQGVALFLLSISGYISVGLLFALTLFGGVVTAFHQPARMALLPALVAPHTLPTAVAINAMAFNTARFAGPALAGLILAFGDISTAFLFHAVAFAVFALCLALIRPSSSDEQERDSSGVFTAFGDGLRHVRGHAGLSGLFLSLIIVSLFGRPLLELLPKFTALLGLGASGFAAMTSVVGLGAILGAVLLAARATPRLLARLSVLNGFAVAGLLTALTLTAWLPLVGFLLLLLGASIVVSGIASQTLIQINSGGRFRGRMLALHVVIFRGGPAVGALGIGALSDLAGLPSALLAAAVACLLSTAWLWIGRERMWSSLEPDAGSPGGMTVKRMRDE